MATLDGKVALVTGGAGGIGRAVVEGYVEAGAKVAVLDRDEERLREVAETFGDDVVTTLGSVENLADNQRAVADTVEAFGKLDVFVGNAGVGAGNLSLMIFSCSIASYRAVDDGTLYVSTKHANLGIVRGLAFEFAPKVRVNGVAIGVARTKMEGLAALGQEPLDAVLPGAEEVIPLGFIPEPRDYAEGFVYWPPTRHGW
ncbi:SDR family NAD(P)-dependent oxidoreductase [Gordonia paraffinivorans]|uniref:SDR family NAD(P)-dependent oxidoreductase n=1 Tax=Gordonia paraffinivorans TaxID=175628 RepID=UPI003FCD96D6